MEQSLSLLLSTVKEDTASTKLSLGKSILESEGQVAALRRQICSLREISIRALHLANLQNSQSSQLEQLRGLYLAQRLKSNELQSELARLMQERQKNREGDSQLLQMRQQIANQAQLSHRRRQQYMQAKHAEERSTLVNELESLADRDNFKDRAIVELLRLLKSKQAEANSLNTRAAQLQSVLSTLKPVQNPINQQLLMKVRQTNSQKLELQFKYQNLRQENAQLKQRIDRSTSKLIVLQQQLNAVQLHRCQPCQKLAQARCNLNKAELLRFQEQNRTRELASLLQLKMLENRTLQVALQHQQGKSQDLAQQLQDRNHVKTNLQDLKRRHRQTQLQLQHSKADFLKLAQHSERVEQELRRQKELLRSCQNSLAHQRSRNQVVNFQLNHKSAVLQNQFQRRKAAAHHLLLWQGRDSVTQNSSWRLRTHLSSISQQISLLRLSAPTIPSQCQSCGRAQQDLKSMRENCLRVIDSIAECTDWPSK